MSANFEARTRPSATELGRQQTELVQTWSRFGAAATPEEFCQNWITPVPSGMAGTIRARDKAIVEAACRAVCVICNLEGPPAHHHESDGELMHGPWTPCDAKAIREALRSLLEESK